ncbi:MAG: class I tRNA ligase family protein, partial [Acidobacteriota bacterium]|nr:class I tRNA ligase family protein [Acidobacteriota bacterium]
MSDTPQKFYLTTPIYYVNARPHIGHAYSTIAADVIARRHRLLGDDTFFLTGTDEHGQKVERSAAAAGIPPQQFADQVSDSFRALWKRMGITNDDYIRTTETRHKQGVQKLWKHLEDRGAIYLSTYTGQYSIGEEMFVEGPPGTIGPDGKPTETVTEENYFFRLSDYQLPLIDLIESEDPENRLHIQPESSRNEVLSFLRGNVAAVVSQAVDTHIGPIDLEGIETTLSERGELAEAESKEFYVPGALKDLSISRTSFKWGVPVPGNEKHVIYVWLDALANYMTALGYGSDKPEEIAQFEKYWPADLHLVGKEITRFHCVYWPAFLLALNPKLQRKPGDQATPILAPAEHAEWARNWVPKSVVANGWLLFEDSKMSKSKGNVVRTETILDAFGEHVYKKQFPDSTKAEQDLFAADVLRYFLLREIPFGQDGSFSFDALVQRYNSELANGYGNLVSRILALIHQSSSGVIPQDHSSVLIPIALRTLSTEDKFSFYFKDCLFSMAIQTISENIRDVDGFISEKAPWKLAKDEGPQSKALLEEVLYTAAEAIRIITALLYPILPYATAKVWAQLGLGDIEAAARNGELKHLQWGGLKPGTKL